MGDFGREAMMRQLVMLVIVDNVSGRLNDARYDQGDLCVTEKSQSELPLAGLHTQRFLKIRNGALPSERSIAAVLKKLHPRFEIEYICEADPTPIRYLNPCCVE
jgi:hypothetical protein